MTGEDCKAEHLLLLVRSCIAVLEPLVRREVLSVNRWSENKGVYSGLLLGVPSKFCKGSHFISIS